MKEIYINIMEKALEAYGDEKIDSYIDSVRNIELPDQGFPRLTANIGVLIAKGRCMRMLPRFIDMMNICCEKIPNRNFIANDFSIKEICFCFMELDESDAIDKAQLDVWKDKIRALDPYKSYNNVVALNPKKHYGNWAAFGAASEFIRAKYLGVDSDEFLELQIGSQVVSLNENGLYKEWQHPILYDFVARLELSVPLFFGYNGQYASVIDEKLKRAGDISLKYQSVTGELPFGGRSCSFLYNEAVMSAVYEFEASRYKKLGDNKKAGEFKAAAMLSARSLKCQLETFPGHIKNFYDPDKKIACEDYGHFLKYMISVASYAHNAYLYADDSIEPTSCPAERGGFVMETDRDFHKIVANFKDYYLEFETEANFHYDTNGLGRVQKKNAPGAICIATTFPKAPLYKVEKENEFDASLCCYAEKDGKLLTGADEGVRYTKISEEISDNSLKLKLDCTLTDGSVVSESYEITENGIDIVLGGDAVDGLLIPVFIYDGKNAPENEIGDGQITVRYFGHTCKYTFDGVARPADDYFFNRNGRYKVYKTSGARLHIEID